PFSPPFPYTTLFRSVGAAHLVQAHVLVAVVVVAGENLQHGGEGGGAHDGGDDLVIAHGAAHAAHLALQQLLIGVAAQGGLAPHRSEEHTSELQSRFD